MKMKKRDETNEWMKNVKEKAKMNMKSTQGYFRIIIILLGAQEICLVHKATAFENVDEIHHESGQSLGLRSAGSRK